MDGLAVSFGTDLQIWDAHLRPGFDSRNLKFRSVVGPTIEAFYSYLARDVVIDIKVERVAHEVFHLNIAGLILYRVRVS